MITKAKAIALLLCLFVLNDSAIAHFGYRRDNTGKRVEDTNYVASVAFSQSYVYDRLNRLTTDHFTYPDPGDPTYTLTDTAVYTFDDVGNRTQYDFTPDGGSTDTVTYTHDTNDRLTAHTCDANGNTTVGTDIAAQTVHDEYDFENRLIRRRAPDNITILLEYHYDDAGNRVRKYNHVTDRLTTYHVDSLNPTGYAQVIREEHETISGGTSLGSASYVYGLDLHSQTDDQAVTHYYGYDGHGNVRYLTDNTGTITDTYDYDAYGNLIGTSGSTPNAYLYTGEQYDADLGLYYLRARFYEPTSGRFWNMDSWEGDSGDPITLNKYLYAHANPVNLGDPSGHIAVVMSLAGGNILSNVGRAVKSAVVVAVKRQATRTLIKLSLATALAVTVSNHDHDAEDRPTIVEDFPSPLRVFIFRGLGGKKRGQPKIYYKAKLNRGEFRVDSDGVSCFEIGFLPGNKPYALPLMVRLRGPKTPGVPYQVTGIRGCTATYTPQFGPGHWSVNCIPQTATADNLSAYAKVMQSVIVRNPWWFGSERVEPHSF